MLSFAAGAVALLAAEYLASTLSYRGLWRAFTRSLVRTWVKLQLTTSLEPHLPCPPTASPLLRPLRHQPVLPAALHEPEIHVPEQEVPFL